VQVFLDGALLHASEYSFASTTSITLAAAPETGTPVEFHYVTNVSTQHRHRETRQLTVGNAPIAVALEQAALTDSVFRITLEGMTSASDEFIFSQSREIVSSPHIAAQGTLVRVRTIEFARLYRHALSDIDTIQFVRADTMQDGIDAYEEDAVPGGWTTQLLYDTDWVIEDGYIQADSYIEEAWFERPRFDIQEGRLNFGDLIQFVEPTSDAYLNRLQAIFTSYYSATTAYMIENGANVILGAAFALQEGKLTLHDPHESVTITDVNGNALAYDLHPTAPDRLDTEMARFHALTEFAKLLPIDALDSVALLTVAEAHNPEFRQGKRLDYHVPKEITRTDTWNPTSLTFSDLTQDYVNDGVWVGDTVLLQPVSGDPYVTRITEVTATSFTVESLPASDVAGFGEGGFGEGGFGGAAAYSPIATYTIYARDVRQVDIGASIDIVPQAERDAVAARISALLNTFVQVLKVRWEAINPTNLTNLAHFIRRIKSAYSAIHIVTYVNNDDGLRETASLDVEESLALEDDLDILIDQFFAGKAGFVADDVVTNEFTLSAATVGPSDTEVTLLSYANVPTSPSAPSFHVQVQYDATAAPGLAVTVSGLGTLATPYLVLVEGDGTDTLQDVADAVNGDITAATLVYVAVTGEPTDVADTSLVATTLEGSPTPPTYADHVGAFVGPIDVA
jgi:hypothetical protein